MTQDPGSGQTVNGAAPQPPQNNRENTGSRRRPKRLKAKHLSPLTKRIIVERFTVLESYEDVARDMQIPGLTGQTVSECLHLHIVRKPPSSTPTLTAASATSRRVA